MLAIGYGPSAGAAHLGVLALSACDLLFERIPSLDDGPGREPAIRDALWPLSSCTPVEVQVHRIGATLTQRRLLNCRPHPFPCGNRRRSLDRAP